MATGTTVTFITLTCFLLLTPLVLCSDDSGDSTCTNGGPIQTWTLSDAKLSVKTYAQYLAYDADFNRDCIWVFGGPESSGNYGCSTCMDCYNITDNTRYSYDILPNGGYTWGHPGAAIIDGIIYYINQNGQIYSYDIINEDESENPLITMPVTGNDGCLTKDPNNDKLYIVSPDYGTNVFYIYNIKHNNLTQGPSLSYDRYIPVCAVNEYYNDPYLYVLAGSTSAIERINLRTLDKWELLSLKLDNDYVDGPCGASTFDTEGTDNNPGRHAAVATFANYIYVITGYIGNSPSAANSDDVIVLDVKNWEIKWVGRYPWELHGLAAIYVETTKRIYGFGGYDFGITDRIDLIYYSNEAFFLPSPQPTSVPSNPTSSPLVTPTSEPSTKPTEEPTGQPSDIPTDEPTKEPTDEPTREPTDEPSDEPTSEPSDRPTDGPTSRPTGNPTTQNNQNNNNNPSTPSNPTSRPTAQPSVVNVDSGDSGNNNGELNSNKSNSSDEVEDLTIGLIALSVVVFVCCIAGICLFCISAYCYCYKKDRGYDMMNGHGFNTVYVGNGHNSNNNNGIRSRQQRRIHNNGNFTVSSNNQNEIELGSHMSGHMSGGLDYETHMANSALVYGESGQIDPINQINAPQRGQGAQGGQGGQGGRPVQRQGDHVRLQKVVSNSLVSGNGRGVGVNPLDRVANRNQDDELYMAPVNGINNDILNNIGDDKKAHVTVDGKEIAIDYKDLVAILGSKSDNNGGNNNNNDTTLIAGEDISGIDSD